MEHLGAGDVCGGRGGEGGALAKSSLEHEVAEENGSEKGGKTRQHGHLS